MFRHPPPGDDPIGVVPAEGQGIVGVETLVAIVVDVGEEWFAHPSIIPQPNCLRHNAAPVI